MSRFPESLTAGALESGRSLLPLITGGALAIASLAKAVTKVRQGHMGVRTRFGRTHDKHGMLYGIEDAGICFTFPFTHSMELVDVRDRNNEIPPITAELSHDRQVVVEASITWHVMKELDFPYRARFMVGDDAALEKIVINHCREELASLCTGAEEIDKDVMARRIIHRSAPSLLEYGVEVLSVQIHDTARSLGQMLRGTGTMSAILNDVVEGS